MFNVHLGSVTRLDSTRRQLNLAEKWSLGLQPVLVYTSSEVVGEFALLHTTLRSFGLRGGSALFRLSYRSVSPDELEAHRPPHVFRSERYSK